MIRLITSLLLLITLTSCASVDSGTVAEPVISVDPTPAVKPRAAATAVSNNLSLLKASNGRIIDENSNIVRLRGVNISGWLLNENWINPGFKIFGGHEHENSMRSHIERKYPGQNTGKLFLDEYRRHFITRGDLAYWSSLGFNMVRLNVSHLLLKQGEQGYQLMDRVIDWANQVGIYVIIDLVTAPGCANQIEYCDPGKRANLWSQGNLDKTEALWRVIAQRYRGRKNVAGYNLINEPNVGSHETLKKAYRRLIKAVRQVDQQHIIFLDGNNYATNFEVFSDGSLAAMDSNLVYSFHLYTASSCRAGARTRQKILKFIENPILNKIEGQQVPVLLGEYAGNCSRWIAVVHTVMQEKGVEHLSYYSPKCARGSYANSKCLSRMSGYGKWADLLKRADSGALPPDWRSDAGFKELESSNFIYDQERLRALQRDYR